MNHDRVVRTADICDEHREARVLEVLFFDYSRKNNFHGEVVTLSTYEDNEGLRELLARGGQGKVLVIDGRGSRRRALVGGKIAVLAAQQQWEGLVINGCIRDQHEFSDLNTGFKAIGTAPMPPNKNGIAREGVGLSFAGVEIKPGEYLYADEDGVIVLEKPVHK